MSQNSAKTTITAITLQGNPVASQTLGSGQDGQVFVITSFSSPGIVNSTDQSNIGWIATQDTA